MNNLKHALKDNIELAWAKASKLLAIKKY